MADGTEYTYYSFDEDDSTGEVAVVVAMNTSGGVSATSKVAVIDTIGKSSSNGDTVYTVDFYMNGELQSAVTTAEMEGEDDIKDAETGDIFHLNVSGDTITAAEKVMDYAGYDEKSYATAPVITMKKTGDSNTDYIFGLVTKVNGSRVTYAAYTGNTAPVDATTGLESKNVENANVYVYDSNLKNQLYVGSIADAYADTILTSGDNEVFVEDETTAVKAPNGIRGMLNSVFIKVVNNKVSDVVVYLPYEFKYAVK